MCDSGAYEKLREVGQGVVRLVGDEGAQQGLGVVAADQPVGRGVIRVIEDEHDHFMNPPVGDYEGGRVELTSHGITLGGRGNRQ